MAFNFKKLLKTIFGQLINDAKDKAPVMIDKAKDDLTKRSASEIAKAAAALKARLDRQKEAK